MLTTLDHAILTVFDGRNSSTNVLDMVILESAKDLFAFSTGVSLRNVIIGPY